MTITYNCTGLTTQRTLATLSVFDPERRKDAEARYKRFEKLFKVQARLWELANTLLDRHELKLRDGKERPLSVVVGASLGKAMKTFFGINDLCLAGWGEDALILLRSNVNLLINLGYILSDSEPNERAADFIASSYLDRVDYLKTAHGVEGLTWKPGMSDEELKLRAKRWRGLSIKKRAAKVAQFQYTTGYAFYSSIEHSDAMALGGYIAEWDEIGPRINAGPSDDELEIALGHSVMVMAEVLTLCCAHFKVESPEVFKEVGELVKSITE